VIAAAFICGPSGADDWMLPHKLRVLSAMCDRIFVLLDRSPSSEAICRQFPKCEFRHVQSGDYPMVKDGPQWDEGLMRQQVWDWATECHPEYVILGDTDEVPTPDIAEWLSGGPDAAVNCWLADWVNLCPDAAHAIGGSECIWSFQTDGSNKKGIVVKYDPAREYCYKLDYRRHVRLEPSPMRRRTSLTCDSIRMGPTKLLHYRWANWGRWAASDMAALPYYQPWPPAGAQIIDVPRSWLWRWSADELVDSLPDTVAVVGNGACTLGAGDEIDAHESVIRFNNFVTYGYEQHVGKKTSVWATNCWPDVAMRPWTGPMMAIHTDDEQQDHIGQWLGAYPHMHQPLKTSWVDAARPLQPRKPSTGLVVIARLLAAGKRVDAYGFDGLATGHYWDADHQHDHSDETAAITTLTKAGVTFR